MAKKKTKLEHTGEPPVMDDADGVRSSKAAQGEEVRELMAVGQEVVPGMSLQRICRDHQRTIGRIAWLRCGRFIIPATITRMAAKRQEMSSE